MNSIKTLIESYDSMEINVYDINISEVLSISIYDPPSGEQPKGQP